MATTNFYTINIKNKEAVEHPALSVEPLKETEPLDSSVETHSRMEKIRNLENDVQPPEENWVQLLLWTHEVRSGVLRVTVLQYVLRQPFAINLTFLYTVKRLVQLQIAHIFKDLYSLRYVRNSVVYDGGRQERIFRKLSKECWLLSKGSSFCQIKRRIHVLYWTGPGGKWIISHTCGGGG